MWGRHHDDVVGVIDVGSNTVRLLVARGRREVLSERVMLRLGAEVERYGRIPDEKLDEAAAVVAGFARDARKAGVVALEVLITSPGRQAENGEELLRRLGDAAGCSARVLSAIEEGTLAFHGALEAADPAARRTVGVVDVGGGSAQVVIGTRRDGPVWARSIDIGSQRLTSRMFRTDPPGEESIAAARAEVERYLEGFDPPLPRVAYAVGGSARAVKRLAGSQLDDAALAYVIELVTSTPTAELVERHGVDPERVRTIAAGAVILSALQERLETPLKVVRAGVREGALIELGARRAAA
jgi:exopolyphosphatase / guanosine-5'-triphosphate,3'-diphosphate pyrophosphatase